MADEGSQSVYTKTEVDAAIAAHKADASAHHTKTTSGDEITSGTIAEPRVASTIARDTEVDAAVAAEATARDAAIAAEATARDVAIATHKADASAHHSNVVDITFIIDGGGSAITTGEKGHLEIPFACTITGWTLLADQSGSIVIDVWKDTYANFPPTVADTIAGSEKPTLISVQKNQDLTLTTWTTAVAAGDILAFNVDSVATVTRVTLSIRATKT